MDREQMQTLSAYGDMGPTSNSIDTFDHHHHHHHHHRIFIDDEPENDAPLSTTDCGYARPFLFLDIIWNLAFVLVSFSVLLTTIQERPSTPLRVWILGYALQSLLHVGIVWAEYQRRSLDDVGVREFNFRGLFTFSSLCHNSIIKKLESINTVISSIWWVFGFYWTVTGGQALLQDSPRLYWLSVVFLAFDVFFMIFCIAMACIVFFALFCCFPILSTVAYAMTVGEGASENDIRALPKYRYRLPNALGNDMKQEEVSITSQSDDSNLAAELTLNPEDSECCICLYKYVDGVELCTLPCNHHFHHTCIGKWLQISATCPLCKLNILKGKNSV
ncbi:E3 ubiquitin- ligase At4g11680-like isoform X1 [Olea europaea subsp. europaea]|uniref:RING-type E3 ubiquitin transferase n=1 Tax=Olea europaea subsp. europaea TaxID=158383 RepID=A0A8S0U7K2_OLEEU|nr:E3 ubiquitin- ligase At4g11680-like isoform X1 [Olea europaea subsp. europaea]